MLLEEAKIELKISKALQKLRHLNTINNENQYHLRYFLRFMSFR